MFCDMSLMKHSSGEVTKSAGGATINQPKRLLIVDNNEQESGTFGELAQVLGYSVTCTWSGREALAYLAASRFDLLLLDQYVADMYVGDFMERVLRLPDRPRIVVMKTSNWKPIKYAKSLGPCELVEKAHVNSIVETLKKCAPSAFSERR